MSYRRCSWYTFALALLVLTVLTCLPALADDAPLLVIRDVELSAPVTPVAWNGDVRDLPAPREWKPGDPVKEIPMRFYPPPGAGTLAPDKLGTDPLLHFQQDILSETGITANTFTVPNRNFAGQGYTGVNPPDTVGDVGPDHYIQMINAAGGAIVRIWDKGEPVPALLSTFALDTLGSGNCASGKGDPIVLYDRQAERWLRRSLPIQAIISAFSFHKPRTPSAADGTTTISVHRRFLTIPSTPSGVPTRMAARGHTSSRPMTAVPVCTGWTGARC
jgi:hypothetical protein